MNIPERRFTDDNVELTMATNHVGPFLFSCLILPKLIAAAKNVPKGSVRVINLASAAVNASAVRFDDLRYEKGASELPEEQKPNFAMMKGFGFDFDPELKYNFIASYGEFCSLHYLFFMSQEFSSSNAFLCLIGCPSNGSREPAYSGSRPANARM